MKRSEALEELRKILAMNGKDDGMGELEEALLHTMESIGMLPPMSDETMSSNPFNVTDSILESVAHDFKWETEDE
jgi:hypothetical protein